VQHDRTLHVDMTGGAARQDAWRQRTGREQHINTT
jgi:hypothetical protein